MKKISFKIIIFISNKKQSKMSNFREIINSVFDSRSSGMMIMDYIETPKEEYKKVYDQQIHTLKKKIKSDGCWTWNPNRFPDLYFPYLLNPVSLTEEEVESLPKLLFEKLVCNGLYRQFVNWILEMEDDEDGGSPFVKRDLFNRLQKNRMWNLCDDPVTLRFKLMCDYIRNCSDNERYKDKGLRFREIENIIKSDFIQLVRTEMFKDGTLNGRPYNQLDTRTEEERMIDYCMYFFYYNKEIK